MKSKKDMHFYEPGPYAEFVGKVSSIYVKPNPSVWKDISGRLDEMCSRKRRISYWQISAAAASILILFSFGLSYFILNEQNYTLNSNFLPQGKTIISHLSSHIPIASNSIAITPSVIKTANLENKEEPNMLVEDYLHIGSSTSPSQMSPILLDVIGIEKPATPIEAPKSKRYDYQEILKNENSATIQTKREFVSEAGKWSLLVFVNPSYSHHTSAALNYKSNPSERGAWMWGGEILARREINNIFAIYTGISVNPTGQNIKDLILLQSGNISKQMEYLYAQTSYGQVTLESHRVGISNFSNLGNAPEDVLKSSSLNTAELRQRFYYMEMPFIVSTRSATGIIDFEIKLGLSAGVLASNRFEVISSLGSFDGQNEGIRKFNASALGAICLSIPVNNQVNLLVEPNVRLSLLSLSHSYTSTYPFSASVRFGLSYQF